MYTLKKVLHALSLCALMSSLSAAVYTNYGSRDAGFVTTSTGGLTVATDAVMKVVNGRVDLNSASNISKDISMTDSRLRIADKNLDARLTGKINFSPAGQITLGTSGDRLLLMGGETPAKIIVSENATVAGSGIFGGDIEVASGKTLTLDVQSVIEKDITGSGSVLLKDDLQLGASRVIKVPTIDCGGYTIRFGLTDLSLEENLTFNSSSGSVSLGANITLASTWTLGSASALFINGNGNTLTVGSAGIIDFADSGSNGSRNLYLTDLKIAFTAGSANENALKGYGSNTNMYATDTVFATASAGVFRVVGQAQMRPQSYNLMNNLKWISAAEIEVLRDITLAGAWEFTVDDSRINGSERMIDLGSGSLKLANNVDLYLSDVALSEMKAASLSIGSGAKLHLTNVSLFDDGGAVMRIVGSANATEAAAVLAPAASTTAGNLFATDLAWSNGAVIEIQKPVSMGSTWTITDNTIINALGNTIDVTSGVFSIASGKTLTLTNAIITGLRSTSFQCADSTATLQLNNCVVSLNADVTLGVSSPARYTQITGVGVNTILTGAYSLIFDTNSKLTVGAGSAVYYDTLGTTDIENVRATNGLITITSGGRLAATVSRDSRNITVSGSTYLSESKFLFPDVGTTNGTQVLFPATATLEGQGRSLIFADTTPSALSLSRTMVTVGATGSTSVLATFKNIVLDGFESGCVSLLGTGSSIKFDTGTTIKLRHDDALTRAYTFGGTTNAVMVLDLNGYDLDMSDSNAKITLLGTGISGTSLVIKNGRLMNVSGTKLDTTLGGAPAAIGLPGGNKMAITLQDVDVVLAGDMSTSGIEWTIKGNCTLSSAGTGSYTWTNTAAVDNSSIVTAPQSRQAICFTIEKGARFTIMNGTTYKHAGATDNFVMVDKSSKLELMGGIFWGASASTVNQVATNTSLGTDTDGVRLRKGSLYVDHTASLSGSVRIGGSSGDASYNLVTGVVSGATNNTLYLEIMPGALIGVTGGVVTYANVDTSA